MPAKPKTVHLYPVPGASIPGVPSEECDVPEDVAADLLAYIPAAFTTEPPRGRETAPDAP